MVGEEYRELPNLRGELLPQHWETLCKNLRRMGLVWDGSLPEQSETGPVTATRQDFLDYAKENNLPPPSAGRAWRILVDAFERKVNADFYENYHRHTGGRAASLPVNFHTYPAVDPKLPWEKRDKQLVGGLDVRSLQTLVEQIDVSVDAHGIKPGIAAVVGLNAGPAVLEFWRGFVTARLTELDS